MGLLTSVGLGGLILFVVFTLIAVVIFAKDLPSPYKLTTRDVALSTKIYDRNGELLYDIYGDQNRALVQLSDLPDQVKNSAISIEDKDFYSHKGFAPMGIARALFNIVFKQSLQGGSTITQQVVKNTLLSPERTITRKIREFILAIQIERRYSKDEILQIYFNEVPYGGTAVGIEAAAETYFHKKAKDLTLTEAVVLAGLPQRPSVYSPFGSDPKAYIARSEAVARRMREDGKISEEQEKQIVSELPNVQFAAQGFGIKAPHFVLFVRDQLEEQYGTRVVEQGGLKVTTSLDLKLQDEAQKIVTEEVNKLTNLKVGNAAVVVTNPKTGEILSMVGSKDYFADPFPEGCTPGDDCIFEPNVNVATRLRQPGSSIKPVNYASAFRQGYSPAYMVMDVSTEFPGGTGLPVYKPVNYDGQFHGPSQLRYALGNSYNIPAVKVLALGGIKNMLTLADQMGLENLKPTDDNLRRFGLALTLGGGEVRLVDMVEAYGVFANYGERQELVSVLKVTDSNNKTLQEYKPSNGKKVLPEEVAFLVSSVLSDNAARANAFGAGSLLNIGGKTVAAKTGTTDDKRDNWTLGYTSSRNNDQPRAVGVWVGNNDNSAMNPSLTSGVTGAAPIWNRVIRIALAETKNTPFEVPKNIVQREVDALDGGLPCQDHPKRNEYFVKGAEPTTSCIFWKKASDGQEYLIFKEDDPVSADGKNRWQEGIDAWIAGKGESFYHPPGDAKFDEGSSSNLGENEVKVNILGPAPESDVSGEFTIEAAVLSKKSIAFVEFRVDGTLVGSKSDTPYLYKYTFPEGVTGKKKIEVKAYNSSGDSGQSDVTVNVQ